jgi:subtilase family serine protease
MSKRRRRPLRPILDQLDDRCLLSGLTPAQLTQAYDLNSIEFSTPSGTVKGDGSGQTIALIEAYHDPTLASDLATFDQEFSLPAPPQLIVADQAGGATNAGWALEESMDVEWAHAIAPGATILVVEAQSQSRQALINAVNAARYTPGVVAISMSWGFSETANEAIYNNVFTTPPGHRGITFFAASGDSGQGGGSEWPSVSPTVVSVGGTTLNLSYSGRYLSETAWVDSSGGLSRFEREPAYQRSTQGSGKRSTPDVAFDGDPNTGVAVYQSSLDYGQGPWEVVGGTSLGGPAWAAIIAIVDQGRTLEGKPELDGATQTLPALYSLPSSDFNIVAPLEGSRISQAEAAGANPYTGLGTPNGQALVADLVATNISSVLTVSKARTSARTRAAVASSSKHSQTVVAKHLVPSYRDLKSHAVAFFRVNK